jgi:hypothetical protein
MHKLNVALIGVYPPPYGLVSLGELDIYCERGATIWLIVPKIGDYPDRQNGMVRA